LKRIHVVLLAVGFAWFVAFSSLIGSGVILRETRLGILARLLDKLPSPLGASVFALLYWTFLLGWIILIGIALEPLVRKDTKG